jgi:site-specific DNA recombinase
MKKTRVYRYYTCSRKIKAGARACSNGSIPAAQLEAAVVDVIRCIAEDSELRREVVTQSHLDQERELIELQVQQKQLQRQLARDRPTLERLLVANEQTAVTASHRDDLRARIAESEKDLAEVREKLVALRSRELSQADVDLAMSNFDNVWNALRQDEKEKLLGLLIAKIEFDRQDCSLKISFHPTAIKTIRSSATEATE